LYAERSQPPEAKDFLCRFAKPASAGTALIGKARWSEELTALVDAYLVRGGTITRIPPKPRTKRKINFTKYSAGLQGRNPFKTAKIAENEARSANSRGVVIAITGAACSAKAGTPGPITAAGVLKRLQAAFALARAEHVAQLNELIGCRVFDAILGREAVAEFVVTGKHTGYAVHKLPSHNRGVSRPARGPEQMAQQETRRRGHGAPFVARPSR
jgi:hypothetical protein